MPSTHSRRLGVAGALVAGLAITGVAVAQSDTNQSGTTAHRADKSTVSGESNATVERQRGIVLEGSAPGIAVTVYENSVHGNSIQLVLGDPDEGSFGHLEQSEPFVVDGVLDATVDVDGRTVTLSGTVAPSGRPARLVEPLQDAGEQIVARGTNTPLVADVVLNVDGASAPLEFAPAFAYDLEVRKVTLYGN
jgi:hypothetical protein